MKLRNFPNWFSGRIFFKGRGTIPFMMALTIEVNKPCLAFVEFGPSHPRPGLEKNLLSIETYLDLCVSQVKIVNISLII
jgi:hypothetical protein